MLSDSWKRRAYDRLHGALEPRGRSDDATEAPATPGLAVSADPRSGGAAADGLAAGRLLAADWVAAPALRLIVFPRAGDLMMLVACLSLPLYAAAVEKLPFVGDSGATTTRAARSW